nr:MAG TPA_asm: hypothetical protein [Caudoviricetes sp.]
MQQHTIKCYYSINYIRSFLLCQYFPSKKYTKKLCFLSNQQRIIYFFYNNVLNTYLGSLLYLLYRTI